MRAKCSTGVIFVGHGRSMQILFASHDRSAQKSTSSLFDMGLLPSEVVLSQFEDGVNCGVEVEARRRELPFTSPQKKSRTSNVQRTPSGFPSFINFCQSLRHLEHNHSSHQWYEPIVRCHY